MPLKAWQAHEVVVAGAVLDEFRVRLEHQAVLHRPTTWSL